MSVSSSPLSGGPWLAKIRGIHKVEEGNIVSGDDGRVLMR